MCLAKNGVELDPDDDAAYELVVAVAAGEMDEVGEMPPRSHCGGRRRSHPRARRVYEPGAHQVGPRYPICQPPNVPVLIAQGLRVVAAVSDGPVRSAALLSSQSRAYSCERRCARSPCQDGGRCTD